MVTFLQFTVSAKSQLLVHSYHLAVNNADSLYFSFANIFEIVSAALCSLIGRGLARTGYFCYGSVAASGIVALLPGFDLSLCSVVDLLKL